MEAIEMDRDTLLVASTEEVTGPGAAKTVERFPLTIDTSHLTIEQKIERTTRLLDFLANCDPTASSPSDQLARVVVVVPLYFSEALLPKFETEAAREEFVGDVTRSVTLACAAHLVIDEACEQASEDLERLEDARDGADQLELPFPTEEDC